VSPCGRFWIPNSSAIRLQTFSRRLRLISSIRSTKYPGAGRGGGEGFGQRRTCTRKLPYYFFNMDGGALLRTNIVPIGRFLKSFSSSGSTSILGGGRRSFRLIKVIPVKAFLSRLISNFK
jgi:hypothetical protein